MHQANVPHSALGDLYLRVASQLDALQPPADARLRHVEDATRVLETPLLPPRERVHDFLQQNAKFRPTEELSRRRHPTTAISTADLKPSPSISPPPLRRDSMEVPSASPSLATASAAEASTLAAPVFVPVGGRARVFQAPDLARAKRSLQRRRHALTQLQGSKGANGAAWDMAQSSTAAASSRSGKQALIAELVQGTAFSTQHIFHMSRKFKEIAGASKSVITFAEFRQILSDDVTALLAAAEDPPPEDAPEAAAAEAGAACSDVDMRAISATIAASESFLRRLFQMFDGDGDGKIDFREFVVGLNAFATGSIDDKADALFAVYTGGSAAPATASASEPTVAISDLLGLFQGDRQLYQELMRSVDEYFARAPSAAGDDHEEATTIAAEDFVAASLAEPALLETISRPTSSLVFSEDALLREQLKAFVGRRGVRWSKMLALLRLAIAWHAREAASPSPSSSASASASRSASPPRSSSDLLVPIAHALPMLSESLGGSASPAEDDYEELNRLLRRYIAKGGGSERPATSSAQLNLLAFLQDLTVVLQHPTSAAGEPGDAEAKARYYFELFDLDGDGLLSRHELVSAVCAGFAHFGPHLTEVVRVLEAEDADMDGQLTKTQYLRAARRSSLILASLYTCL